MASDEVTQLSFLDLVIQSLFDGGISIVPDSLSHIAKEVLEVFQVDTFFIVFVVFLWLVVIVFDKGLLMVGDDGGYDFGDGWGQEWQIFLIEVESLE